MDVLADVLNAARLGATALNELHAHAPWGIRLPEAPLAAFHAVLEGECVVVVNGGEPVRLVAGDVTLLPTGAGHVLASSASVPAKSVVCLSELHPVEPGIVHVPGPGPLTHLMCAGVAYQHDGAHPALSLLPKVVHLTSQDTAAARGLDATLAMLAGELVDDQPGVQTVVDRMVDVVFVQILRAWIAREDGAQSAWLRALRDPIVAGALARIHDEPAHPWSVAELADAVGMSRAAFARRFAELVGEPPLTYVTRWRIDLAARRLRTLDQPVSAVARGVGYTSEYAFSRAFSRARGISPARYRIAAREADVGA
jgi:AraC-like DNA-binding protein